MEFLCEKKYLLFPVSKDASLKTVSFWCDGELVLDLKIGLDEEAPDYVAAYPTERFLGKTLKLTSEPEMNFEIRQSDEKPEFPEERYRPLVRFSSESGWINDPNGLVYADGLYHLFFQHNPVGAKWENMHWGHAVSRDLIHWEQWEDALFPDDMGSMFSGSAIVDENNLLGVKSNEYSTIVLFYTAAGNTSLLSERKKFTQCMAYSTDGGRTFQKYERNPVVSHVESQNRDPKVTYCAEIGAYIMAIYLEDDRYLLLCSENLVDWETLEQVKLPGDWECPDFYPLALDGDSENKKWIFSGARDYYLVGSFDGTHFVPETEVLQMERGKDGHAYAAQTWPELSDGRKIKIFWKNIRIPGKCFDGSMTIPCELSLHSTSEGMRLFVNPVRELETLYDAEETFEKMSAGERKTLSAAAYDISAELCADEAADCELSLFGIKLRFDFVQKTFSAGFNGQYRHAFEPKKRFSIRILADTDGLEIFLDNGAFYFVCFEVADFNLPYLTFSKKSGEAELQNLKIHRLQKA